MKGEKKGLSPAAVRVFKVLLIFCCFLETEIKPKLAGFGS